MSKRKTFTKGQAVEILPMAGDEVWVPAIFVCVEPMPSNYRGPGIYRVTLTQPDRYPYGRHPRTVPSRRIRARKEAPPQRECEESPGGRHVYDIDDEYAQKHHLSREDTPVNCVHCGADAPDDITAEIRGEL